MTYHFEEIQNGRLEEGQTLIIIENHLAEIKTGDKEAVALAERHGGTIAPGKADKATKPLKEQ